MATGQEHEPELLLIPGPVSIDDEILEVLGEPVWPHYGDAWTELYLRTTANLRQIFRTESEVHLLFGPGMAAVETALTSVLSRGDKVLIPSNGLFGERMTDVARTTGLEVIGVETGPREAVSADAVRAALDAHPELRAVSVVHHETSIGVLNPVREIAAMARERNLLTIVDAVSSAGGVELDVDGWGIDICVTVANKCLGGPIGVAPITAGPRAIAALEDGRPKAAGWYLNLATWRKFTDLWRDWHPHPTTMPTNVIRALDLAVQRVLAVGLDEHLRRQRAARDTVRGGLREIGFEMMVPDEVASPVTTAVMGLPGMDVPGYMKWLLDEHGLRIGGGFGQFAGKAFRIGHMGRAADPAVIDRYLALTARYVEGRR
ncbi:MAG TPA: alanine--glyoxylate aminotransferase family protein [Candidatus Dormibacteraeota bacterium]|nr:alanine--glyoxylate aminotransferase family protein [Candidatus Dormibacteraeota bacterium]